MERTFSEIINFVIMTSSLFMFTLDNIRSEGDTEFAFVVLLLYDKILSNPIKILKKDRFIAGFCGV